LSSFNTVAWTHWLELTRRVLFSNDDFRMPPSAMSAVDIAEEQEKGPDAPTSSCMPESIRDQDNFGFIPGTAYRECDPSCKVNGGCRS